MSLTEKDAKAYQGTIDVENILADFFLKEFDMRNSRSDYDEEHQRKSKHKKHKKSKHKLKTRSRSSSPTGELIARKVDERVFSSEEKEIKRLKKIKNIEARDNKVRPYLPALHSTLIEQYSSENHSSLVINSGDIDVPYGPSLELLLSGTEVSRIENESGIVVSPSHEVDEACSSKEKSNSDEKGNISNVASVGNLNIDSEVQNNLSQNRENLFTKKAEPTTDNENICTASKDSVKAFEANKESESLRVEKAPKKEDNKYVEKHSHKYSRSRSRSKSKTRKRNRSPQSKSMRHSRSRSGSRYKSYRRRRSYSRDRSNSKERRSRLRHIRSRSKESWRRNKRLSRSRSRSAKKSRSKSKESSKRSTKYSSRSGSRSAKRSRSKESSKRSKKHSSRSRSRSAKKPRSRSKESSTKHSSRNRSRSTKRSRSKESSKRSTKHSSRSRSRSAKKSRSRSKESSKRSKKHLSRSRSRSAKKSRSRSKESCKRSMKRSSRSRSRSVQRSRSKESSKRNENHLTRSQSRSAKTSRSKSKELKNRGNRYSSRSRSKSVKRSRSKSKELSNRGKKRSSRSHSRSTKRSRSKESSKRNKKHSSRSQSRSSKKSRSRSKESSKRSRRHSSRSKSRSVKRSRSKSKESSKRNKRHSSRSRSRSAPRHRKRTNSRSYSRDRYRSTHTSRGRNSSYRSRSYSRGHSNSRSRRESSPSSRSRSKRSRSKSREKNCDSIKSNKIDQAKILQIAQKNVLTMIEKGTLPEGLSLDLFKKEQLVSLKSGGKSVQELTDFCVKLSEKENESNEETKPGSANDANNQDGDSDFIHHPFKLKEQPMIKLNIKNAIQIPIKTHAEKFAETAKLSSQFPVSSGNQHKQKELEWIPVVPEKSKSAQNVAESKTVVAVAPKTEVIQEIAKSETPTPVSSTNTILHIPLPAKTVPALAPPPLPPLLPPPPPSPLLLATSTPVSCQPDLSSNIYTMPTPTVSYPTPPSNNPFSIVPNDPVLPPAETGLASSSSSAVSSTTFKPTKHIDISSIVTKRFKALTKLQADANDALALQTLHEAQSSIQEWVESQQVPGLFTGSTDAKLLTVEELCGPRNWNYRVKRTLKYVSCIRIRVCNSLQQALNLSQENNSFAFNLQTRELMFDAMDIFTRAAPVTEGKGMSLLKKMGWNPGEGLGKNKEGSLEPLLLDVKTDKKGLVSIGESGKRATASVVKELQGKHPVSALMELCSKRKWKPPLYNMVKDQGPPHKKIFLFKVEVNGVDYLPASPSPNKKVAKADAAVVCLQALNVFPK